MHPRARGRGDLLDTDPVFVRLGRRRGSELPEPLSAKTVHKLVHDAAIAAGIPNRLAHPHRLRTYWATGLLEDGVAIHTVSARLGHAGLRTTSRYAADRPEDRDDVADPLDRRHQTDWRRRAGARSR